jgi:hypothetical protein
MPTVTTSSVTQLLSTFSLPLSGRFGAGVCLEVFLLSCHCFHAQLDLTRDTHFLLFVIVNAAAYFALDAHHCNNTTGSRRKELHRAGHRKSLRSPIPPFPLSMSVSSHGFYAHGVQASWAGLTAIIGFWFLVLFSFIWFTITTDGLRFGSSFTGYLIGTTSQSKISIPHCATLLLLFYYPPHLSISLLAIAFYNPRVRNVLF